MARQLGVTKSAVHQRLAKLPGKQSTAPESQNAPEPGPLKWRDPLSLDNSYAACLYGALIAITEENGNYYDFPEELYDAITEACVPEEDLKDGLWPVTVASFEERLVRFAPIFEAHGIGLSRDLQGGISVSRIRKANNSGAAPAILFADVLEAFRLKDAEIAGLKGQIMENEAAFASTYDDFVKTANANELLRATVKKVEDELLAARQEAARVAKISDDRGKKIAALKQDVAALRQQVQKQEAEYLELLQEKDRAHSDFNDLQDYLKRTLSTPKSAPVNASSN